MANFNYYKSELDRINFHCLYSPTVQFKDENGATKNMAVNQESAKEIIKKLKKEFNIK